MSATGGEGRSVEGRSAEGRGAREVTEILETDEARHLIDAAAAAGGSLSTDEIALGLDELDLDAGQIDEFYSALESRRRARSRPTRSSSS